MRQKNVRYKSPIFQAEIALLKFPADGSKGCTIAEIMEATGESINTTRSALKDMGLVKHRSEPQKKAAPKERECDCCMKVKYIPFGRASCPKCLIFLADEEKKDEERERKHPHTCLKCKGEYDTRHDARGFPIHKMCFGCRESNKHIAGGMA